MNLPDGWTYDETAAQYAVDFIEQLSHGQAEWAGTKWTLLDFEEDIVRRVYGTFNADGERGIRLVTLLTPSGAGKTSFASALIILEMMEAGPNAELVGIAKDSKQAGRIWTRIKGTLEQNFTLMSGFDLRKQPLRVIRIGTDATFQIASKEIGQVLGSAQTFTFIDELAVVAEETIQQIHTMSAKQKSGWILQATTAAMGDVSRHSYAFEQFELIKAISEGEESTDPSFYGVVFAADPELPWDSLETAYTASPSLGITLDPKIIENEIIKAKRSPRLIPAYRCFRLNQFQSEVEGGMIDMVAWRKSGTDWDASEMENLECWLGLDVSSRLDLTAAVCVFNWGADSIRVLPFFWAPEEGLYERSQESRIPYTLWRDLGLLTTIPGPTIDQRWLKKHILDDIAGRFLVRAVGFDPWSARQLASELEDEGLETWEVRQGFATLGAPSARLAELVIAGKLDHGNNKILEAHAEATVGKMDENANVRPDKKRSQMKIDGISALVMAIDMWTRHGQETADAGDFAWL